MARTTGSNTTALTKATNHPALPDDDAVRLARSLESARDVTVFVDGTALQLPADASAVVLDALTRLAAGESVTVSTAEAWLNTSQAAQLAGVSNTYMRNLTDAGAIPVHYRGTHRRVRPEDVQAWLESRAAAVHDAEEADV
ncbi:helix-turn-helix domain-containing protein [Zhihengliuella salsuginis]|uniref:Excisionase n=1 Tax=Zhihengliuella salsuginis TaxID=578222 RepID=A0ABQ3GGH1_9MICC|nr:helix-turn-helix domain-containing protein [Zhihengliuella salsuginis]GHD05075.1 excisionase [Zhihengliuella salsuginis]